MILIEDDNHCERGGTFERFEDAVAELRRRAAIPWDEPPNKAPCSSWRTCGRAYYVLEYDASGAQWIRLREAAVLNISAKGVEWVEDFEKAWAASAAGGK